MISNPQVFLLTKILFSIQAVQAMKKSLRVCLQILSLPRQRSAMQRRRALEEVREMAKVFGDTVCKELDLQRPRSDLQRTEER